MGLGDFAVSAWELKTRSGTVVFGGRVIPGIDEAMAEIARRAHVTIVDEGSVGVSPIRALVQGTPEWGQKGDG